MGWQFQASAEKENRVSRTPRPAMAKLDIAHEAQGSLAQIAYKELRREIHNKRLSAGQRLREVAVSKRLKMSRTPVREALKRLEAEGLVRFEPPRGFVVMQLTPAQVMALYAMRKVLVGAAVRFAAEHASAIEIQSMQQII